jgi:hypothetical protein
MQVLYAWFKELLEKWWSQKGAEKEPLLDDLVLKTQYNPIWDIIKIGPIHNAMIKDWGSFTTTDQTDSLPIRYYSSIVGVKEVIISKMSMAQWLISARIVIAFSRTISFGDMVNHWNEDLLLVEEPEIELADYPNQLQVSTNALIITHAEGGFSGREVYGKWWKITVYSFYCCVIYSDA